jgi:hypothetical protein
MVDYFMTRYLVTIIQYSSFVKQIEKAHESVKHSQEHFSSLNESADPSMVEKWSKDEEEAIQNRHACEEAMNIFDMKVSKSWQYYHINIVRLG